MEYTAVAMKLGTELHDDDRAHVLATYVHRMTTEAQREWPDFAKSMKRGGWKMPERTDAEWLAATRFAVRKNGRLDRRYKHCLTAHTPWEKTLSSFFFRR